MNKRPLSVLLIALLYIAVGIIGMAYHFTEFGHHGLFHSDVYLTELAEASALLCGVFMLRGRNWARWLAVAWIGFHVVLSAFQNAGAFFMHLGICVVIAWAVFSPQASRYFQPST